MATAKKITKDDVIGFLEGMTVLELSELVKELEEKFGVSAAAPVAAVAAGPAAAAPAEEKQSLMLYSPDLANRKYRLSRLPGP